MGNAHHGHDHGHHGLGVRGEAEGVFRLGLAADVALAAGKAVTGYVSGSTAIIADAGHSLSDVVLSGVAWWSFRVAKVPKDKEHPYGIPRKQKTVHNHRGDPISTDFLNEDAHDENTHNSLDLPLIDLETILAATNNYSSDNKLGEGGFGPVYKGILPNSGKQVAIKRLSAKSRQGKKEFMTEVMLIAKLQHKNLVRLLYCCMEKDEMLLIYEYMPNKSLDTFIFGLPLHPFHPFL